LKRATLTLVSLAFGACEFSVPEHVSVAAGDASVDRDARATTGCVDVDEDGYGEGCSLGADCDDNDPQKNPGMPEFCDYLDNDCNGLVDDGTLRGLSCDAGYDVAARVA